MSSPPVKSFGLDLDFFLVFCKEYLALHVYKKELDLLLLFRAFDSFGTFIHYYLQILQCFAVVACEITI